MQIAELCENTRRGARGLIVPARHPSWIAQRAPPARTDHRASHPALGLRPRELALDGGFAPGPVAAHLPHPDRAFIAGRHSAGSRKTNRRLAQFRVGAEGRISHLKRRYGMRRSRLKGHSGARTWAAWAILAYNLDTLAIRASLTASSPGLSARAATFRTAASPPERGRFPFTPRDRLSGASTTALDAAVRGLGVWGRPPRHH